MRRQLVVILHPAALDAMGTDVDMQSATMLRAAADMVARGDVGQCFTNIRDASGASLTDRHGYAVGVVGFKPETWPR